METLTELGRHQICKAIGIMNPNSTFVKSKEAFIDRMNLYRLTYNIDELVEAYKEELSKCKSEENLIKKITKDKNKIYNTVKREIVKAENIDIIFGNRNIARALDATTEYNVFLRDEYSECTLRIYFESPIYEAFKFLVLGFYECKSTFREFVLELTNNKFIAATKDLVLEEISEISIRNTIQAQLNLISNVIVDIVCPKCINSKNVKFIKGAEVKVSSTVNKTTESLDRLVDEIRNADGCTFENVCVELFTLKYLSKNTDISLKKLILPNEEYSKLNVVNYDEYTLIRYLRKIRGEQESIYDSILANGYKELQVTHGLDIAWL